MWEIAPYPLWIFDWCICSKSNLPKETIELPCCSLASLTSLSLQLVAQKWLLKCNIVFYHLHFRSDDGSDDDDNNDDGDYDDYDGDGGGNNHATAAAMC